ncbi:hypothetical protein SEPCBS119000_003965 [Sporothrix epigloea]|uniref:Protein phosphatase n=1 Tax=Sporothrix epigloea TaxID=1892477 RepID=A0ABP0DT88_9PEZI
MRSLPLRFRTRPSLRFPLLDPVSSGLLSRATQSGPWLCSYNGSSCNGRCLHSTKARSSWSALPITFPVTADHFATKPRLKRRVATASTLGPYDHPAGQGCGAGKNLAASPKPALPRLPFYFETGVGLFAKRTPRPFPPPFLSPPSGSFSDALSTHDRSRDRRELVDGQLIGGCTNGDDAVYVSDYFVAANDGVGAWSMRPRGHAGLWSRLVVHFWAKAVNESIASGKMTTPDPVGYLQCAYEQTIEATQVPNDWQGTTTAAGALLWYRPVEPVATMGRKHADTSENGSDNSYEPVLYVTNLGDSQVMVVRPTEGRIIFKTKEQWHWFDCPRQLGTNSPDTPRENAVVDVVPIRVGDIVLAMSDGLIDNLWAHEIVDKVCQSVATWQVKDKTPADLQRGMMTAVAEELVEAARVIAVDPFAESPYMEHAIEEGLASEGALYSNFIKTLTFVQENSTILAW